MERCLACEAVVSKGLRDARLSLSALYIYQKPQEPIQTSGPSHQQRCSPSASQARQRSRSGGPAPSLARILPSSLAVAWYGVQTFLASSALVIVVLNGPAE
jgi:hypothetical protein